MYVRFCFFTSKKNDVVKHFQQHSCPENFEKVSSRTPFKNNRNSPPFYVRCCFKNYRINSPLVTTLRSLNTISDYCLDSLGKSKYYLLATTIYVHINKLLLNTFNLYFVPKFCRT